MIVIIDYGMGNIGSIMNMIRKAGGESILTSEISVIEQAQKIILPGVGTFDHGMKNLMEKGLTGVLNKKVLQDRVPVLGICLGMQLMTLGSEEGQLPGLGWFQARTVRFDFPEGSPRLRIPHMGWNEVEVKKEHALFNEMPDDPSFYFVHSYHAVCERPGDVLTTTHYGYDFTSSIARENIAATQFHPEKSHRYGLQIIRNFVNL